MVGTIGLTMTIGERILPNLTGVDLGCGMTIAKIRSGRKEWQRLDSCIADRIPSGFAVRKTPHSKSDKFDFGSLLCEKHINLEKALKSLGTLGGGNHFIETDQDRDGSLYIIIPSGSRHLGKEVTEYYLDMGQKTLRENGIEVPYPLTWLEGSLRDSYLHDVQAYAALNREIMLQEILKGMKWKEEEHYICMHNYIASDQDTLQAFGRPVLRKGAISAKDGERLIIPINMRDGVILGIGLGNRDWNCSAPHVAGRILKRENVKNKFTLSAFRKSMKGIYSTSISADTLDEAPFAYRSTDDILNVIGDSVSVDKNLRPVFNFKAGSKK